MRMTHTLLDEDQMAWLKGRLADITAGPSRNEECTYERQSKAELAGCFAWESSGAVEK